MGRISKEERSEKAITRIGKRVIKKFLKPRKLIKRKDVSLWQQNIQSEIIRAVRRKFD